MQLCEEQHRPEGPVRAEALGWAVSDVLGEGAPIVAAAARAGEASTGTGARHTGPCGHREDCGFSPREKGAPPRQDRPQRETSPSGSSSFSPVVLTPVGGPAWSFLLAGEEAEDPDPGPCRRPLHTTPGSCRGPASRGARRTPSVRGVPPSGFPAPH